jgi:hypothetical protein
MNKKEGVTMEDTQKSSSSTATRMPCGRPEIG